MNKPKILPKNTSNNQVNKPSKVTSVHVAVVLDTFTSTSIATINKDLSDGFKQDVKVLRQFGIIN